MFSALNKAKQGKLDTFSQHFILTADYILSKLHLSLVSLHTLLMMTY